MKHTPSMISDAEINKAKASKPLYKILDEQRTQGKLSEFILNDIRYLVTANETGETVYVSTIHGLLDGKENDKRRIETKANAQYTALCVNNLASIAEALQPLVNLAKEVFKDTATNKQGVLYAFNSAEITYNDLRAAMEAITKIS